MQIERTGKEIIIRLPATVDTDDLQSFLDHVRYKELTANLSVTKAQTDQLARQVKKGWWAKNRQRLLK